MYGARWRKFWTTACRDQLAEWEIATGKYDTNVNPRGRANRTRTVNRNKGHVRLQRYLSRWWRTEGMLLILAFRKQHQNFGFFRVVQRLLVSLRKHNIQEEEREVCVFGKFVKIGRVELFERSLRAKSDVRGRINKLQVTLKNSTKDPRSKTEIREIEGCSRFIVFFLRSSDFLRVDIYC